MCVCVCVCVCLFYVCVCVCGCVYLVEEDVQIGAKINFDASAQGYM